MNRALWKGRSVFITGHTGFKGSWLSLWLQDAGARVTGYALDPPTTPSLFQAAHVADGMHSIRGDVRDLERLRTALADAQPDVILHLAAQSVVRASYDDPVETYGTNVMGTVNLFEAVRGSGRPAAVVNVTSDKCYENLEQDRGYREEDRLGGHDPYSSSKACAELVTSAFRDSFFAVPQSGASRVRLASVRAGNVIGGGDWTRDQLLPDTVRSFTAGKKVRLRNPDAVRPWQFVLEPLRGYLMVAEQLLHSDTGAGRAWNFGPDDRDCLSVRQVVERFAEGWGNAPGWEQDPGFHPHETRLLKLDSTLARERLGWSPRLPLAEGLGWTAQWYREAARGADARSLTLEQIHRYEARVKA